MEGSAPKSLGQQLSNSVVTFILNSRYTEKAKYVDALYAHKGYMNALPLCRFCDMAIVKPAEEGLPKCTRCNKRCACLGPYCMAKAKSTTLQCPKCQRLGLCPNCIDTDGCAVCGEVICGLCAYVTKYPQSAVTDEHKRNAPIVFTICSEKCAESISAKRIKTDQ
jgi:hypothetical protein